MSEQKSDYFSWFLIAFLVFALAALTVLSQSGCPRKPIIVEKPVEVPVACGLPPVAVKPELEFNGSPPCPESHPVCMTADVATLLVIYLSETETWVEEVRALCGEEVEDDLIPLGAPPPESAPDG